MSNQSKSNHFASDEKSVRDFSSDATLSASAIESDDAAAASTNYLDTDNAVENGLPPSEFPSNPKDILNALENEAPELKCHKCGAVLDNSDAKSCPLCGEKISRIRRAALKEQAYIERTGKKYKSRARRATSVMTKVAILTALATVLLLLEFPIFPAAPFYKMEFSGVPCLIASFMFGPWIGVLVSTLRVLLFVMFQGTSSAFIGELSNIVGGAMFVIPAGLIYQRMHNFKGAVLASVAGALSFTVTMVVMNWFVLLPFYVRFMPNLADPTARMLLVFTWCLPFNLIKGVACVAMTTLLYRATRKVFKMF